jgi:hypothetical protein
MCDVLRAVLSSAHNVTIAKAQVADVTMHSSGSSSSRGVRTTYARYSIASGKAKPSMRATSASEPDYRGDVMCAVLCCVGLCCVMLRRDMMCCVVLCCVALCAAVCTG